MVFHTGPTKVALVLLSCIGIWLSVCMSSFGEPTRKEVKKILRHLKHESQKLLQEYEKEEPGIPTKWPTEFYPPLLPCFAWGPDASHNISVIKTYLDKIKILSKNQSDTSNVTKRLDDISCHTLTKTNISEPENCDDTYQCKRFILTVLQQFAECMSKVKIKAKSC